MRVRVSHRPSQFPISVEAFRLWCESAGNLARKSFNQLAVQQVCMGLFPFRMISDTRIECRHADSQWRTSPCAPAGAHGERAESGGPGPLAVDGFLPP